MRRSWFENRPRLLGRIRDDLRARYPDLQVVQEAGLVFVRGSLPIVHDEVVLDRFQIEIEFAPDYPMSLPKVRETAGRVPRVLDRHVIPSTGYACLFVEEDWLVTVGREPDFFEFLDGPIRHFFIGQSLVEAGKPWPFGARSHGKKGVMEVYAEWFGTEDEPTIRRYLDCLSRDGLKGHWYCPCGSGRRIRACHGALLRSVRERIPTWAAQQAAKRLKYLDGLEDRHVAFAKEAERAASAPSPK